MGGHNLSIPVKIGLTILKIRVRQMLGCLTIDNAPAVHNHVYRSTFYGMCGTFAKLNSSLALAAKNK